MKARVQFTVDVGDDQRRAINQYYGRPGLATRDQVREWFRDYGQEGGVQELATIMYFQSDDDD